MGEPSAPLGVGATLQDRLRMHTLPFTAALLGCSLEEAWDRPCTFQVFDDVEHRRDPRMAKTLHGSLASLADELERRNLGGAGIFITVNETDVAGRRKENISSLRAWWADLDGAAAQGIFQIEASPMPPSLVVRSGHGVHLYWSTEQSLTCAGDDARQRAHEEELKCIRLAFAPYGADPAVCEVARVMRLPGFFNRKREPHQLVELLHSSPVRYTQGQVQAAFPMANEPKKSPPMRGNPTVRCGETLRRARAYLEVLARETPAIAGSHGHSTTLQVAIKVACGFDLAEDEAIPLLQEVYNPACLPPWSEAELRRKVQEAQKVCLERGWLNKRLPAGAHTQAEQ